MPHDQTAPRSNEDAAREIASQMFRRFGFDLLASEAAIRWLAQCVGEVRAEVVDNTVPPHRIASRWSKQ